MNHREITAWYARFIADNRARQDAAEVERAAVAAVRGRRCGREWEVS